MSKNGKQLRHLMNKAMIDADEALILCNKGRNQSWTTTQWQSFLSNADAPDWKPCPDSVVLRMEKVLREILKK